MTGDDVAITQRELLMELREDVRLLRAAIVDMAADQQRLADSIKVEVDLGNERRLAMRRAADAISAQVADHANRIDVLERRNDRQDGALMFSRAAFGTSIVALLAVAIQVAEALGWIR